MIKKNTLYKEIENLVSNLSFEEISEERKNVLQPLIVYIQEKTTANAPIRLNFICTHNSRRSHLSQIWAQTMAWYCGINNVYCYSGGTEATALFPTVAETLTDSGFQIKQLSQGNNPIYSIKYTDNEPAIIGFSKHYEADFNPKSAFAALLSCSQADTGCPFIAGAEKRIPLPYEDPKAFDGLPEQALKYQERSLQIAAELLYVFTHIKS